MTTVNIAFSGGVESVYLLQLALERGFNVNLCLINVHNVLDNRLGELVACEKIIKYFETRMREDQDYLPKASWKYAGQIKDIIHVAVCPWVPSQNDNRSPVTFEVTQQFSTILGMMFAAANISTVSLPPAGSVGSNRMLRSSVVMNTITLKKIMALCCDFHRCLVL